MQELLHKETLALFAQALEIVNSGQRIRITAEPTKVLDADYGQCYKNATPVNVKITRRQYGGNFYSGIWAQVQDHDVLTEGVPKIDHMFIPTPSHVVVNLPLLDDVSGRAAQGFADLMIIGLDGAAKLAGFENGIEDIAEEVNVAFDAILGPEDEKTAQIDPNEFKFEIPDDFGKIPVNTSKFNLLQRGVDPDPYHLHSDDPIVKVIYNGEYEQDGMIILGVKETPDGIFVVYKLIDDYAGVKQEALGYTLTGRAALLWLIAQPNAILPVPNKTHYSLIRSLEYVEVRPAKVYASNRHFGVDIFATEAPVQPEVKDRHMDLVWQLEECVVEDSTTIVPSTPVVSLKVNGKWQAGMVITQVAWEQGRRVMIAYKDIMHGYSNDNGRNIIFGHLMAGRRVSIPQKINYITTYDIQDIGIYTAKNFAATTVLDSRSSGTDPAMTQILTDKEAAELEADLTRNIVQQYF